MYQPRHLIVSIACVDRLSRASEIVTLVPNGIIAHRCDYMYLPRRVAGLRQIRSVRVMMRNERHADPPLPRLSARHHALPVPCAVC